MSGSDKQEKNEISRKIRQARADFEWHAVSRMRDEARDEKGADEGILSGDLPEIQPEKNLESEKFAGKKLDGNDFHGASLLNGDFKNASLKGVSFTGADLSGADFSGADLTGADLSGSILKGANFTGACLNGVRLENADLEDVILLDVRIDEMGLEELQALIEYLAKYFPHKLNLAKINLTLLDLKKIDLKNVNLRGADFTGVDFTGVNIIGLNLSECIITPEQIAQAMGRVPSREELAKLLAPRKKGGKKGNSGIDWTDFFFNDGKEIGVWDATKGGVDIDKILKAGRQVFRHTAEKPKLKVNDEQIVEQAKSEQKSKEDEHNEKIREVIEKNRQAVLEARKERQKELQEENRNKEVDVSLVMGRGGNER